MNFFALLTGAPPDRDREDLETDEVGPLDEPTYLRRRAEAQASGGYQSGLRSVRIKPLEWTSAPPQKPGFYYVRFQGETDYIAVRVEPEFDYQPGRVEWAGPLPTPRKDS